MGVVPVGNPLLPPPVPGDADELASAPIGAGVVAPSCGDGDALVVGFLDPGGSGGGRCRLSC